MQFLEAPLGVEKVRACVKIKNRNFAIQSHLSTSFSCKEKGQGWTTVPGKTDFLGPVGGCVVNCLLMNMLQGPLAPEPSGCEQSSTLCTQKEKMFPNVVGGKMADRAETPQTAIRVSLHPLPGSLLISCVTGHVPVLWVMVMLCSSHLRGRCLGYLNCSSLLPHVLGKL